MTVPPIDRRTILKTIGAGVAAGTAASGLGAAKHRSKGRKHLDPLWGYTGAVEDFSGEFPSPEEFPPQIRPDHVVELHFDETLGALHFHPTGLRVQPGDVVMFQFASHDHSVTAFHERIRGETRVPDGVGPFSSPVLPIGGYWLYRFGEEGVYDLFCGPHELLGMVMRIVADDGQGEAPSGHEGTRGPSPFHLFNYLEELGLAPENPPFTYPSSLETLGSDALDPENVISEGEVHYTEVFAEFNPGI